MTKTDKKPMSVQALLDVVKRAYTIKDWGDQYRVYAKDSIVFVFMDDSKNITHFSTMFLANGGLNKILVSDEEAKQIKSAICARFVEFSKSIKPTEQQVKIK